jgi:hypothetical protein
MIIVRFAGGLANRMFQYAYYKSLEARGKNVYIDDNYKPSKWMFEDVDIKKIFPNIKYNKAKKSDILFHLGGKDLLSKILRRIPISSLLVKNESKSTFITLCNNIKNGYVIGTFSSEKYFADIKELIRKDFTFTKFIDEKNIELMNIIKKENSVAIHIRKGEDYNKSRVHGTCDIYYYNRAILYIKEHINSPHFFVFTDNKEWVKNNLQLIDYQLIDLNPTEGWGNHFDMQLMSCCKHNIIANSTYSWWGAYLNNNPMKIIIAPTKWYSNTNKSSRELGYIPNEWVTL